MSYLPGSKLETSGQNGEFASQVIVLSDNKVMFTSHVFSGEMMTLVDWLILAEGHEKQTNTIEKADKIWAHAKEKSGIDPPPMSHISEATDDFKFKEFVPYFTDGPDIPHSQDSQIPVSHLPELLMPEQLQLPPLPLLTAFQKVDEPAPLPELRGYPERYVGDKIKWELNDETYRIAVFTAKGLLQVKSVTDGGGETHDSSCKCRACCEYNMVPRPPWRQARPLKKIFFEDEAAWRASLPQAGKILFKCPGEQNWY